MITLDDVVAQTRRIAAAAPDTVHASMHLTCVAPTGGIPVGSCLIGCALVAAGIDAALLASFDEDPDRMDFDVDSLLQELVRGRLVQQWPGGDPRVSWLLDVQVGQDTGVPWGVCVSDADDARPPL